MNASRLIALSLLALAFALPAELAAQGLRWSMENYGTAHRQLGGAPAPYRQQLHNVSLELRQHQFSSQRPNAPVVTPRIFQTQEPLASSGATQPDLIATQEFLFNPTATSDPEDIAAASGAGLGYVNFIEGVLYDGDPVQYQVPDDVGGAATPGTENIFISPLSAYPSPVPEPGTGAMLLATAAGLLAWRRRRSA